MATRKKTITVRIRPGYGKHHVDRYATKAGEENGQFLGSEVYTSKSEPFEIPEAVYNALCEKFELVTAASSGN